MFPFVVKPSVFATFQVRLLFPHWEIGLLPFLIISEMAPRSLRKTFLCCETSKRLVCLHLTEASQVTLVVKNPPANAGDTRDEGSIPGLGRSLGVGNGNPLQYSCLETSMNRGTWWTTDHGIAKSQTGVNTHTHTPPHTYRGRICNCKFSKVNIPRKEESGAYSQKETCL